MNEVENIPRLRFPEFSDEWKEILFSDLYNFNTTNSYSRDKLNYDNGKIRNIHYGDIHTKFKSQFHIEKEEVPFINFDVDINKIKHNNYLKKGDLVIADASEDYSEIGKSIEIIDIKNEKVVAGLHTLHAKSKNKLQLGFGSFLVKCPSSRLSFMMIAQGTKVLGISSSRVNKIKFQIPSLPEQQKIADFLTLVDKRIELLEKKKTLLETYKKGVMKKIFNQEIRFKDENGNDFPDWEEKRLGELFNFIRGSSLAKSDLDIDGEFKCIHYGELFTIYNEVIRTIFSNTNKEGTRSIHGDILMPTSDVTPYGLATASCIREKDVVLGGDMNILRSKSDIEPVFFSYLLNFNVGSIIKMVTGTTIKHIYSKDLKPLRFNVPTEKSEQMRIADFFCSIDIQIELFQKQIDKSKTWKKGLLQKMFV